MEQIIQQLETRFNILEKSLERPNQPIIKVGKNEAEAVLRWLRDDHGYTHLAFFTAIDYIEKGFFTLVYMIHNYNTKIDMCVQVDIDRDNAVMYSIHRMWGQAETYQRELKEMYGIDFPGSPRVDEEFCLEGWDQIPPMRREFDTVKFCEERFPARDEGRATVDPRIHMQRSMYPDEGEQS